MDKVTKQRDPKRQAAGRKGHEKYMAKLKEDILKNVSSSNGGGSSSSSSSSNSTNGGINTTNDRVGAIAVLSLGFCIFIIPKLMRNPPQRDKDPEKISKEPEKISEIRRRMF